MISKDRIRYLASIGSGLGAVFFTYKMCTVNKLYDKDINEDGRPDVVLRTGFSFTPDYRLFLRREDGTLKENFSVPREKIISKLEK